jgi:spore coat polysaccharide biosynthesis protein SpsF (cytidylyltransferase family)
VYTQPERFRLHWLDVPAWCADPRLRLTVDTPADLERLRQIVLALGDQAMDASAEEIAGLVFERGDWLEAMTAANASQPKTAGPLPTEHSPTAPPPAAPAHSAR